MPHVARPAATARPAWRDGLDAAIVAPTGSLPSPDEELWIIERPDALVADGGEGPGCGVLMAKGVGAEKKDVAVPLAHTDVKAHISGYIATVEVTQQFHNPYDGKIEAVYVFPLPQNAAVNEFLMTIGKRKIRGIIRERHEAERMYAEAKRQGYVASLLTQERANIFTQSVANIEAGKRIDISIKYFHTLAYDDGWYEYVFPMVVGPRYNPPGYTQGVGAIGRGRPGRAGQATELQYLKPNERSGHDIALTVEVDAGVEIEQLTCRSHKVSITRPVGEKALVKLDPADTIPNKDFVLRYKVAGERVKTALLTHRDQRGGFFSLMIFPPAKLAALERAPLELVFVLDCSGSMSGRPIAQAKAAVDRALSRLQPSDTFQIIRFSNNASQLGRAPLPATRRNVKRGRRYLRSLRGSGGTQMIEGIKAAFDFSHDERRLRFVVFLTDGYIGNDREIVGEVHRRIGASRVFSFGVGSSPNRYLLNRMAKLGRGAVAYLGLHDDGAAVMDGFFDRISHPALADLSVDFEGVAVSDVFPAKIPDLFVGRPVILTGRFSGNGSATVRIRGQAAGTARELRVRAELDDAADHAGLSAVWARMKIADLADRATYNSDIDLPAAIKTTALEHGLMSAYTAFVAVDSLTKTAGDHGTTVAVPVPVPVGVRYETAVHE